MKTTGKGKKSAPTKEKKENELVPPKDELAESAEPKKRYVYTQKLVYSTKEAAKMLGTTEQRINTWIKSGSLFGIDVGHRIILHEDLMDFIRRYRGYDLTNIEDIKKLPFYNMITEDETQYIYLKQEVYSVNELSKILHVNTNKVNSWIKSGILICIDIGHRVVLHEDLMDFIRKNRGYNISDPYKVKRLPFYDTTNDLKA